MMAYHRRPVRPAPGFVADAPRFCELRHVIIDPPVSLRLNPIVELTARCF